MIEPDAVAGHARQVIEDLLACSFISLGLVLRRTNRGTSYEMESWSGWQYALFRLYLRLIDSRHPSVADPLQSVSARDLLHQLPWFDWSEVEATDSAVIQELRAASIDVLLQLTEGEPAAAWRNTARFGIWHTRFGSPQYADARPAYLWECIDRNVVSVARLVAELPAGGPEVTLACVAAATAASLSVTENRFAPYWCAASLPVRKLRELHERGTLEPDACPMPNAVAVRVPAARRRPSNIAMFRWLGQAVPQRVFHRVRLGRRVAHWCVGLRRSRTPLYQGADPEALAEVQWIVAPRGHFWADPILYEHRGDTWLFFEDFIYSSGRGVLACARIQDDGKLHDTRVCLDLPYHLSYPHVFAYGAEIFMIPETSENGTVELWRAAEFPYRWTLERILLRVRAVDSTAFFVRGRWWLTVNVIAVEGQGVPTLLYSASDPTGPWILHPASPISTDIRTARGAGPVIRDGNLLIRPSQDCSENYGRRLRFNQIVELDEHRYSEVEIARIEPGWLPHMIGVHTYSRVGQWETLDGLFEVRPRDVM